MTAVTFQPGVASSVRFEEVPGPDESTGSIPVELAKELFLQNNVIVGSVNANRRHFYRAAEALAAADKDWLGRLITRHVRPENIGDALQRSPDDIKVVVDFGTGA